jgi:hypothetical protein
VPRHACTAYFFRALHKSRRVRNLGIVAHNLGIVAHNLGSHARNLGNASANLGNAFRNLGSDAAHRGSAVANLAKGAPGPSDRNAGLDAARFHPVRHSRRLR